MDTSKLKPYSLGIVAENKPRSTTMILATPYEVRNLIDGQIKSNPTTVEASGKDAQGNAYQASATADNTITADWLRSSNTGRRTAPDVVRGERVQLYRYGDADKYYWASLGLDDNLRKGETVIHTYSGTLSQDEDGTTPEHSWYSEVSTHDGHATFATSTSNGEKTGYTVQIDAKNGVITIKDGLGNVFQMNSAEGILTLLNQYQSSIVMNQKKIAISSQDTIDLSATNEVSFETQLFQVTAPQTNFSENVAVGGNLAVTGSANMAGDVSFSGTLTAQVINCQKLNSAEPISAPNV